jgi:hypothetical protein
MDAAIEVCTKGCPCKANVSNIMVSDLLILSITERLYLIFNVTIDSTASMIPIIKKRITIFDSWYPLI